MASKRKRGDAWEYTVKRAGLLDKPVYLTFSNEIDGDAYCARLEGLLDKGIIPGEFRQDERIVTIAHLARQYEREAHPSIKDRDSLRVICRSKGSTPLPQIDAAWVDGWISELKRFDHAKPGTIISKVGALARCTDWGVRKHLLELPDNPFRTLPNGYAQYTDDDAAHAGGAQVDGERDRRLEDGELDRILAVIDGGILARTQRPYALPYVPALRCLVLLAPESAMRLREMYTLTVSQVSISRRTVSLDKTKNGDKRQVPLSTAAVAALNAYLPARAIPDKHQADLLFPWWDGSTDDVVLRRASNFLSKLFSGIFEAAECPGLLIHDLRHEAVSRLFERTSLSVEAIMKITGHKSHKMMMRYLHLRASSLADAMW